MSTKYNELFSQLFEGVYIVDQKRKIIFWNSGSESITGYTAEEVQNHYCFNNILDHVDEHGNNLCFAGCPLQETLRTGKIANNKLFLRHKNGHRIPIEMRTMPIYDEQGNITAAIEVFHDARYHEDVLIENRRLQEMIVMDELTSTYNRRYVQHRLDSLIDEHKTFGTNFAVLFIDIDHFKTINDTYGHEVGDEMLKLVATTIRMNLRQGDFIGRWGGEEFIVVLKHIHPKHVFQVAEKIRILVEKSNHITENGPIHVTISLGGSPYHSSLSKEEIIKQSDQAMYQAKHNGRNRTVIIDIEE